MASRGASFAKDAVELGLTAEEKRATQAALSSGLDPTIAHDTGPPISGPRPDSRGASQSGGSSFLEHPSPEEQERIASATQKYRRAGPDGSYNWYDAKHGVEFRDGYPVLDEHAVHDLKIKPTGSRRGDAKAANKGAGLPSTPKGHRWHHHQEHGRMQLVPQEVHKVRHNGGFAIWGKKVKSK
jgi:hypothetical protein